MAHRDFTGRDTRVRWSLRWYDPGARHLVTPVNSRRAAGYVDRILWGEYLLRAAVELLRGSARRPIKAVACGGLSPRIRSQPPKQRSKQKGTYHRPELRRHRQQLGR